MASQCPRALRVLICGGGNAAHVFLGELAARGHRPTLLSTWPAEAEKLAQNNLTGDGFVEVRGWEFDGDKLGTMRGKPVSIVGSVAEAFAPRDSFGDCERFDCVVLALPAFAHQSYLDELAPFLKRMPEDSGRFPPVLMAAVAQGGFDMAARAALESARVDRSVVIAGLETLPWACRLVEPGRRADVLGTKSAVDAAIAMHPDPDRDILARHTPPALEMMQTVVGPAPTLRLASGFLGVSLMNINSFWHPTLMWHRWKEWDGQETFDAPPMLYEDAPDDLACDEMSRETADVVAALRRRYGDRLLDTLDSAKSVRRWFLDSYGDEPELDTDSTASMMRTNPAYRGLTHPMRPASDRDDRLVPDFSHRYLTEDVPFGLVVTRGVAELVGVPTPTIDTIISWAQKVSGRTYLIEREMNKPGGELSHPGVEEPGGEHRSPPALVLAGDDVVRSRCPQRFGWFDVDWFMTSNHYAALEPDKEVFGEDGEGKGTRRESSGAAA